MLGKRLSQALSNEGRCISAARRSTIAAEGCAPCSDVEFVLLSPVPVAFWLSSASSAGPSVPLQPSG